MKTSSIFHVDKTIMYFMYCESHVDTYNKGFTCVPVTYKLAIQSDNFFIELGTGQKHGITKKKRVLSVYPRI